MIERRRVVSNETLARGRAPVVRAIALLLLLGALLAVAGPVIADAATPAQPRTSLTYVLADTWSEVPRDAQAGRFVAPRDISSAPDETVYVLGQAHAVPGPAAADGSAQVLHVLDRVGAPLRLIPLGDTFNASTRLDVGYDGVPHVLGRLRAYNGNQWGVVRFAPNGAELGRFELATVGNPHDVAVAPGGDVYVSMVSVTGGLSRIDIYAPDGTLRTSIIPSEMGRDGPDDRFTYTLYKLDVHPDGSVFVIAYARRPCPSGPVRTPRPGPTRTPVPTPTPRPSLAGEVLDGAAASDGMAPDAVGQRTQALPCYKYVVLEFDAAHTFRREVPNSHRSDIATGPSGVYVAASSPSLTPPQRVYKLGARDATFTYRVPDRRDAPIAHSASYMQLDVAADGRLHAVTDMGAPFYRGALTLGDPRSARGAGDDGQVPLGVYDKPALAGPNHPLRIDAGEDVLLLESPRSRSSDEGLPSSTLVTAADNVSAIQRWSTETGAPVGQAAHYGNLSRYGISRYTYNTGAPLVDIATDGGDVFAISGQVVWQRSDALPPAWYRRVEGAHFIAGAAHAGRVAVLDAAGRQVMVLSSGGSVWRAWPVDSGAARGVASDIAYGDDRIYLADQGRNQVMARDERGRDLGEWWTHDGPMRLSVGPSGDVYVLGRGGYGLRYTPAGNLVASWRMPQWYKDVPVDPRDIAVGDDGRVYVSFVGLAAPGAGDLGYRIGAGGVWVFRPVEVDDPLATPPDQDACLAQPDKWADPTLMLLGETTEVTLTVDGLCPGRHAPQQLIIVLDTSWSMHDDYPRSREPGGLARAKDVLGALLSSLDRDSIELGLVTFSDGAGIEVPLPGELGEVRARILSRRADGDTRMGVGVVLAHAELRGTRGDPSVKQTILIVSDGIFKDDPEHAVRAAQSDGIDVVALVTSTTEFNADARARLETVIGDPDKVFVDPVPEAVSGLINQVSAFIPNPGLFETITVEDVVPDNMRFIGGSARPPAEWDPATRTLRWTLGPVTAADGVRLTYRLRPLIPGGWPTNVEASAVYRDALGNDGVLAFPVPRVAVLAPDPLATPTPVATDTPTPLPPTPTARFRVSEPVYLPLVAKRPLCISKVVHVDVALVLDMSTSMYRLTGTGRSKHEAALAAAGLFLDQLETVTGTGGTDQVAVVGFNGRAWTATELTGDRRRLDAALEGLLREVREGTRLDLAFDEARRALTGPGRIAGNQPTIILLTDGHPNRVPTPAPVGGQEDTVLAAADRAKADGITVYTIGLGQASDIRAWMLRGAATEPSQYYETPDAEDLAEIYRGILVRLVCGNG